MKEKTVKSGKYQVTADGSLGLLALGYRGLLAWREARKAKAKVKSQDEK